ncbi:sensor histidine kinase [Lacrimispora algidixylanolytica]|uniref:histidine kinase n=1 Tax=Lacrimispora algidixylanolytica TaxID=94868 RepID=A0A419T2S7_9FIRM|nr:HAMP domain-containing sensor histidine kinase [Lacrimispora algidixylanolytica]RKD31733.1 two-component sensor histidine kinase [Lacrimispora algidixylanolytica]
MNFNLDRQVRNFLIFLLLFVLLLLLSGICLNVLQVRTVQNLFLSHDRAIVSSLLEQGVSENTVSIAFNNMSSSMEGRNLLTKIGISETTASGFLPYVSGFRQTTTYLTLITEIVLSLLLLGGTFHFYMKRVKLYQEATQTVTRFMEGDFSSQISHIDEGPVYHLFACVDHLATILQSKNESEKKAKEFLKNTIADISHQLKTPLAALTMYHEIISDEPDNITTVKEYSVKTGLALKRMEELIQSMLKITRLDAGSIVFEKVSCTVSNLISSAVNDLTTRALSERKEIIIENMAEVCVFCDKYWTSEAISNIVKNALDHTGSGDNIHISWTKTPLMVRIFISDNGKGIAPEDLHHIFKRFYRSKKHLDTQGVGLGLSLAKSIIDGQNGTISVKSGLNEGTTFILSFLTEA